MRQHTVRPAAYSKIQVILDLPRKYRGVGPLGRKYQMNPKGPPQPRNGGQPVLDLPQPFLVLLALTRPVQHLRHLVTGEHQPGQALPRGLVVCVQVGAPGFHQPPLAVFQHSRKLIEGIEQIILGKTHLAFLVPDLGEVHPALEIGNVDLRPLVERLHEQ